MRNKFFLSNDFYSFINLDKRYRPRINQMSDSVKLLQLISILQRRFDSGANAVIIADIGSTGFEGNISGHVYVGFYPVSEGENHE